MFRSLCLAMVSLACLLVIAGPALSAEVTMRLRGSDMTLTGNLVSFDGNTYRIESELFGTVDLEIERFECIAGACSQTTDAPDAAAGPDFAIHGSSSIGWALMPKLIAAYAESIDARVNQHVDADAGESKIDLVDGVGIRLASVDLVAQGSNMAFPALAEARALIGMSSRSITEEERKLLPTVREYMLARDGLLVIVAPDNPISAISIDQFVAVLAGRVSDWADLGQAPGRINVYARNPESGMLETLKSAIAEPATLQVTPDAKLFGSDAELSAAVAVDPRGIGLTGFAHKGKAKALAISTECGLTYVPTVFDIKAEEYPLSRYMYLYASATPDGGHANELLSYALSARAQKKISEAGFITRSVVYRAFRKQGNRFINAFDLSNEEFNLPLMQQLIKDIGQLSRLSVTIRFEASSGTLDKKSQSTVRQLARVLSKDRMRGKKVLLLGFSDAAGGFDRNRELSRVRAREVRQQILRLSEGAVEADLLEAKGYGELLPVGCNDDPLGRAKNRRVEVWIEAPTAPQPKEATAPEPPAQPSVADAADPENRADEPENDAAEVPPAQDAPAAVEMSEERKTRFFEDYLEWRNNLEN